MPVIAMKVKSAQNHPNAEALRLYVMEAPGYEDVEIIANLTTVYEVGDVAAIALADSVLKDGTVIKPTKLRGIPSFGMALGKVTDAVGSDLSSEYCQKNLAKGAKLQEWPSVELLHNVRRTLELTQQSPQVTYRAKVKLDGTNGGVQVFSNGEVVTQSRNLVISTENDNIGFAAWVLKNLEYFEKLRSDKHITIFGEWCGHGIQKRAAISQIDRKIYVVFAIQYGGLDGHSALLEVNPEAITQVLPQHPDIFVLPFYGEPITLNFADEQQLKAAVETINNMVDAVETSDPWVKETFGIEGLGEGLVLYPEAEKPVNKITYSELLFKAKGEKHQVVKTKKPVEVDPQIAESVEQFVDLFLTENRLQQGLTEACLGDCDPKKMGEFLKWIAGDIQKESVAELEASNLSWKDVNKAINNEARKWFLAKASF